MKQSIRLCIVVGAAGIVNGLFGAGGGMVLVPLLTMLTDIDDSDIFSISVATIFPISVVSLIVTALSQQIPLKSALLYLLGGFIGGCIAGICDNKIPVKWLHRILGIFILWGGVRYLI